MNSSKLSFAVPPSVFCERKVRSPSGNVYAEWVRREAELYRVGAARNLMARLSPLTLGPTKGLLNRSDFDSAIWRCAVDSTVQSQNLQSQIHVIENFDADADRDWAHSLARRHGAGCQVRKRSGQVIFAFAKPL